MNIRKKTPAELEHQVADYLLHGDSRKGARYLGKTTELLLEVGHEDVMTDERIRQHNRYANLGDIAELVKNYPSHLNLRSKNPDKRKLYTQKAVAVERYYQDFAALVEEINPDEATGLVEGSYARPYRISKDGQAYIVRAIRPSVGAQQVEKHIDAALKVSDIDHLEHVIAVSYKDNITVAPLLPGKSFKQLEFTGDAKYVTRDQLRDLYSAMKQANARGVGFDGIGGNIFYDREQGFHALDLEPLSSTTTASIALRRQVEYLMMCASLSADVDYVQQIGRIVGDVESIFAEDADAKDDLEILQALQYEDLTEREVDQYRLTTIPDSENFSERYDEHTA